MSNIYEQLSQERKKLQLEGLVPQWYSTGSWQLFKSKYLFGTDRAVRGQFERIAKAAAAYLPESFQAEAEKAFFDLMWEGILSPATPVLSNMGTDRGFPVSCQGSYFEDSIFGIYDTKKDVAMHTKKGFGTSGYLGDIRPRGASISIGGKAEGIVPVWEGIIKDMSYVSQGNTRRGSFAAYVPVDHGDFDEVINYVHATQDDANLGWTYGDDFINRANSGDPEALRRFKRMMSLEMTYGKGYTVNVDVANRNAPPAIKACGIPLVASNLCTEIFLPQNREYNFICVLSSLNLVNWERFKETKAAFWATIFLDCINSDFIKKATGVPGFEKSVKFAEDFRALGLGVMGFHSLLQSKMLPFGSFEAHLLNLEIFDHIEKESLRATQHLANLLGEPKWCKGLGIRNATRTAIAPTKSTAGLMGGVSEGINPDPALVYVQNSAAGDIERVNPYLLKIMKERAKFTKKIIEDIGAKNSVQHVDWLTEEEKKVFLVAFELNMYDHVRLCEARQPKLCQGQSMNVFISSDTEEEDVAELQSFIMQSPVLPARYYTYSARTQRGNNRECEACQG